MTGLNQNPPPIRSPPFPRPVGRATDSARFQEIHEIAPRNADAVHHPHVWQFGASTERVDAASRYSEALGHLTNTQEVSRCVLRTWQHSGSKRSAKGCILLQTAGLGGLAKSRDSNGVLTSEYRTSGISAAIGGPGGRCLTQNEIEDLKRLSSPMVMAYLLAGIAALVAWIAVMVMAFRQGHMGWAILVLLLSAPMAFLYLVIGPAQYRGRFRAVCALSILSPLLLFLANAWRVFATVHGYGHA